MDRKFKDLDLSNAFLFSAAMEDEETCRLILEIILGRSVPHVKVRAEHSILISSDYRSVRLDIYASDEMKVSYNVEMQNANQYDLAKRSRMHQAEMDVASMKPGGDFNDLKPSFIVFICTFDPFDQGLYRYTFEARCRENGAYLEDGACRIFLSTKGRNEEEVAPELIHFLKYVEKSTDDYVEQVQDPSIAKLHEKVAELKNWRELEERYVKFEELLKERENTGKEQGIAQGKAESILELLNEYGDIPDDLNRKILAEHDLRTLSAWHKAAARTADILQFRKETNI